MARTTRELATRPAVDPEDEPSAEWGWHGGFPKTSLVAGWFSVFALLIMLIGNHTGNIENIWLIAVAVVMAIGLVLHTIRQRNSWRR